MAWVFDPMTGEIRFERTTGGSPIVYDSCTQFVYRLQIKQAVKLTMHGDSCMRIINGPSNQQATLAGNLDLGI